MYTLGLSDWLSDADQPTVSFLVWSGLLLFTYILTNKAISDRQSSSGLLAALLGIANGLFYIPTFAPRLIAFIPEVGVASVSSPGTGMEGLLRSVTDMMQTNFCMIWEALGASTANSGRDCVDGAACGRDQYIATRPKLVERIMNCGVSNH